MKRRVVIYGVVLLALAAVVGILAAFGPREPSHDGRPLSEWIHEATEGPDEQRQRAIDAMLAMEPGLFPWLTSKLTTHESPIKRAIRNLTGRQTILGIDLRPHTDEAELAILGFEALGPAARPAIPKLEIRLYSIDDAADGARALASIGDDALPVLLRALMSTNRVTRFNAALALANFRGNRSAAGTELLKVLTNQDDSVVVDAARFSLERLGVSLEMVVATVVSQPGGPDSTVHEQARQTLVRWSRANPRVSQILQELLLAPNPDTRHRAAEALHAMTNRIGRNPPDERPPSAR